MTEPIPVLMYHSIAPPMEDWTFSYLSILPEIFEDQVLTLRSGGYNAISLSELYDYMTGRRRLPPRSVVLTFDDGYLDNWVFAFPILRKHGFRATIFVSTDFIDWRRHTRPNLDDVRQGRIGRENLTWRGFLSQDEIRRMLASDMIDIQGHCKTHTWYFTSGKIVDFHHPGDSYPWLAWNARPERKALYLEEDQGQMVPWGSPVYRHQKALLARRYFPDPRMDRALVEYVADHGGVSFFEMPGWRESLHQVAAQVGSAGTSHRTESREEYLTRLREEIVLSKSELEDLVGKPVTFLCWPGGGYNRTAVRIASEAGYQAWTLSSRDPSFQRNLPGEDPAWIRRTAVAPWWNFAGRKVSQVDGEFLRRIIEEHKGFAFAGLRLRWYKMGKLLRSYVTAGGRMRSHGRTV